jgi:hypothetical protein
MRDVANLRLVPQDVSDQTMKNLNVLGHTGPLAMIANEIDAHFVEGVEDV